MSYYLKKMQSWYNPFSLIEAKDDELGFQIIIDEIDTIYLFDNNTEKTVAETRWFGYNNRFERILIPTDKPIKKKKSLDLKSKVPFCMKAECSYSPKPHHNIYIPTSILEDYSIKQHPIKDARFNVIDSFELSDAISFKAMARLSDYSTSSPLQKTLITFNSNYRFLSLPLQKSIKDLEHMFTALNFSSNTYSIERLIEQEAKAEDKSSANTGESIISHLKDAVKLYNDYMSIRKDFTEYKKYILEDSKGFDEMDETLHDMILRGHDFWNKAIECDDNGLDFIDYK